MSIIRLLTTEKTYSLETADGVFEAVQLLDEDGEEVELTIYDEHQYEIGEDTELFERLVDILEELL